MIEGIFQIGNLVKNGKKVSQIGTDIPNLKKDVKYKICKINFNLDKKIIEFDLLEEFEPGKEEDYKFIQMKLSGMQNQFLATFKDLKRFVGEIDKNTGKVKPYAVWLSIEDEIKTLQSQTQTYSNEVKEEIEEFLKDLKVIKENFYKDYIVDISKLQNFKVKNLSELKKVIKGQLGKGEDIIFYSILINNKKVVEKNFYDELIKKKVIEDKRKEGNVVCYICGKSIKSYFYDLARLPAKFFINDKIGFSQNLSNKWEGNFVLCEECYLSLFAGQKFLMNNFTDRIGEINLLIIPEFLDKIPVTHEKFKEWAELIKDIYNPFKFFDENTLEKKLKEYKEHGYIKYFLLNYIFYEQRNQQFKVFTIIKNLPTGRVDELRNIFFNYRKEINENFPEFGNNTLKSFGEIYWIIPLRYSKADRKIIDIPKITELFYLILNGYQINKDFLIHEFWLGAKAKFFKNRSYHFVGNLKYEAQLTTDEKLCEYILKTHQLLILLKKLNLIDGGKVMDLNGLPEVFKKYIIMVNFNEKQTALFLLGTLIGEIGSKQVKYGSKFRNVNIMEGIDLNSKQTKYGTKPILNKINFQGMSVDRLQILFNEVYQKLKQEKLLYKEEELIYGKAKELFDKNLKNWDLKPHENVYFLLSGYAFKTKLNIEISSKKNRR